MIIGAYYTIVGTNRLGRASIYSGRTGQPIWSWVGEHHECYFGTSVSDAGDVDRDGFADVAVGAPSTIVGTNRVGRASVYSGRTGQPLWSWTGDQHLAGFSYSVSGAGDVNRDGFSDVIVGVPNRIGTSQYGGATVYSGQSGQILWSWSGAHPGARLFGESVAEAGDVNGDGFGDVLVGASAFDEARQSGGYAYAYSGRTGQLLRSWTGEHLGARFGVTVSGAGDVTGDGLADVVVGAPETIVGTNTLGRAYVFCVSDLSLSATPETVVYPQSLALDLRCGAPARPAALFIVGVSGLPSAFTLGSGLLDTNGAWGMTIPPIATLPVDFTLLGASLTAANTLVLSNRVEVHYR